MPYELSAEQHELCGRIAGQLRSVMPSGWDRATLRWSGVTSGGCLSSLYVVDEDGTYLAGSVPPGVNEQCEELRAGMYDVGRGAWYTMFCTLAREPSRYSMRFEDTEPDSSSFIPGHYAEDLRRFPRDEEHMTDWLREKLRQVPNVYGGIHFEYDAQDEPTPTPRDFVAALEGAGWDVGPSAELRGEYTFSTSWAELSTLTNPVMIRFAGRVDQERWDELHALLSGFGWQVGMDCKGPDGETVRQLKPSA